MREGRLTGKTMRITAAAQGIGRASVLACDDSRFVTGQALLVDGGVTI